MYHQPPVGRNDKIGKTAQAIASEIIILFVSKGVTFKVAKTALEYAVHSLDDLYILGSSESSETSVSKNET